MNLSELRGVRAVAAAAVLLLIIGVTAVLVFSVLAPRSDGTQSPSTAQDAQASTTPTSRPDTDAASRDADGTEPIDEPSSRESTASAEATESPEATTTAAADGASAASIAAPPDGSAGADVPPAQPTPGDAADRTRDVAGRVVHEVWRTPVSGVRVRLSPSGRETVSAADGSFRFAGVEPADVTTVWIDTTSGGWRSYGSAIRVIAPDSTTPVTLAVYRASEAAGTDWRDARFWRSAPEETVGSAAAKVARATSTFDGLTQSRAISVLAAGKSGSQRERARAELLATWLDLASGRLGFDTPVNVNADQSARAVLSASNRTVLGVARDADARVASGSTDWNAMRRALDGDLLASPVSASTASAVQDADDGPRGGHGRGRGRSSR